MFYWFPEQVRSRLLLRRRLGYYPKEDCIDTAITRIQRISLLDKGQFSNLLDDCEIRKEKALIFTKSLIAMRN